MIKLENFEVMGWDHAIRGMRNPMNSWDKSDTDWFLFNADELPTDFLDIDPNNSRLYKTIGHNDYELMMKLRNAGTDHRKFMRMITVYVDITAPLYWWKEFDTYKVGTVANSCSTMHKIHERRLDLDDFSCEHLTNQELVTVNGCRPEGMSPKGLLVSIIDMINYYRDSFVEDGKNKDDWWQIIQLLPTSYNQKRTVMLNYEVLANIYKSRKNHKLDEWRELCSWIDGLPYSELITGGKEEK